MIDVSHFKSALLANVPYLRAYAMCLVPKRKQADDLVEKVLVDAWTERQRRGGADTLRARLFMLMHREFRSFERAHFLNLDPCVEKSLISNPQRRDGTGGGFGARLQGLPAPEREAVSLVGACHFSYDQAAAICGCSAPTMKRRVRSACEHLSNLLPFQAQAQPLDHRWHVLN
jgi:RNA polymerase sigma-70 factor (ECF subfamily)